MNKTDLLLEKMATSSSLQSKRLEGKVAIITGGASGIGAATARLFAQHGAKVTIADIQDNLGTSLVQEIGTNVSTYIHCDVAVESDVKNAVDATVAKFGKLDIMFSNAGTAGDQLIPSILEVDYETIKSVFDVNIVGAFFCAKHAARVMIPEKRGAIIFTASVLSAVYCRMLHAYTASKNAIVGLSKNLGVELGEYGIRVNCVSPYFVATLLVLQAFGIDKESAEKFFEQVGNLKGAVLDEEEVAKAVLYLASDDSKYVSGLNVIVDGGFSTTNVALTQTFNKLFPFTTSQQTSI